jgi:hypothetical protein
MYDSVDDWCYFLFVFYLTAFFNEPPRVASLIQAALLSILGFYLKISLGFISVFLFFAATGYAILRRKISLKFFLFTIGAFIFCLWLGAVLLNVDLKGYVLSGLRFINDYNDSMLKPLNAGYLKYLYAALLIMAVLACWMIWRILVSIRRNEILHRLDEFFVFFVIGISLFLLFKSGFVRAEMHFHIFFNGASLLTVLLYLSCPANRGKQIMAAICWLILIIAFAAMSKLPGNYRPYARLADLSFFQNKAGEIKRYIGQVFYYKQARAASDRLNASANELRNIVGAHTVDIIPSEISKIYFNGLKYDPRPVIQSYAAYDKYLDSLNYRKYISASAPDYVLFSVGSIDNRYPFFDETMTKLALLNNYRITGDLDGDLILKKRPVIQNVLNPGHADTFDMKFGEDIPVRSTDSLLYARFFVEYSLWGKAKRFFFQPPALSITFTFENGMTKTFGAVKPVLADGVIINKYVESNRDFQLLMQSDGLLAADVKKIRIGPDGRHSGFRDNIRMVTQHFPFGSRTDADRRADSLAIEALEDRYKPIWVNPYLVEQDSIQYGIRDFNTYSRFIEVRGWAFREHADNGTAEVKAILRSTNKIYELLSVKEDREDLISHFGREDVKGAGFISTVSKSKLEPGDYQLGVAVCYADSSQKWIRYVKDAHILLRSNYNIEKLKSVDHALPHNNDLQYYISSVKDYKDQILIDGWAFIKNIDTRTVKINLLLQDKALVYRINADIIRRDDLVSYFKDPLLEYGGFSTIIPKSALPPGNYTLGIEISDEQGQRHALKFSDRKIHLPE